MKYRSLSIRMLALALALLLLCSGCGLQLPFPKKDAPAADDAASAPDASDNAPDSDAESVSAVRMQLSKFQGDVAVTDKTQKSVEPREALRLRSGYGVATGADGLAWIDLDSTKLTKLAEDSRVELEKHGRALCLTLTEGNLFFNVTKPLEDDETLDIRTATMVVGIRGTCGWVEVPDEAHMNISLLEGSVECTIHDADGSQIASERISAGETAEMTYAGMDSTLVVTELTELPDFVREEVEDITGNPALSEMLELLEERISAGGSLPTGATAEDAVFTSYSGVGYYHDSLTLHADGSFTFGYYMNGDTDSIDGTFRDITQINDHIWELTIGTVSGNQFSADGFAPGSTLQLYGPGTLVNDDPMLTGPFKNFIYVQTSAYPWMVTDGRLNGYAIYIVGTGSCFSTLG